MLSYSGALATRTRSGTGLPPRIEGFRRSWTPSRGVSPPTALSSGRASVPSLDDLQRAPAHRIGIRSRAGLAARSGRRATTATLADPSSMRRCSSACWRPLYDRCGWFPARETPTTACRPRGVSTRRVERRPRRALSGCGAPPRGRPVLTISRARGAAGAGGGRCAARGLTSRWRSAARGTGGRSMPGGPPLHGARRVAGGGRSRRGGGRRRLAGRRGRAPHRRPARTGERQRARRLRGVGARGAGCAARAEGAPAARAADDGRDAARARARDGERAFAVAPAVEPHRRRLPASADGPVCRRPRRPRRLRPRPRRTPRRAAPRAPRGGPSCRASRRS